MTKLQNGWKTQRDWLAALTAGPEFVLILDAQSLQVIAQSAAWVEFWKQQTEAEMPLRVSIDHFWAEPSSKRRQQLLDALMSIKDLGVIQEISLWRIGRKLLTMRWQALPLLAPSGAGAILLKPYTTPQDMKINFGQIRLPASSQEQEIFERFLQQAPPLSSELAFSLLHQMHAALLVVSMEEGPFHERVIYANKALMSWLSEPIMHSVLMQPLSQWAESTLEQAQVQNLRSFLRVDNAPDFDFRVSLRGVHIRLFWKGIRNEQGKVTHWIIHLRDETRSLLETEMNRARSQTMLQALEGFSLDKSLEPMMQALKHLWEGWTVGLLRFAQGRVHLIGPAAGEYRDWLEGIAQSEMEKRWEMRDPSKMGQAIVVSDAPNHPSYLPLRDLLLHHNIRSFVELPLYDSERQLIGILAVSHHEVKTPSLSQIERMEFEAGVMALLIERDHQHDMLQRLAYRDPLTSLYNREAFNKTFAEALEHAKFTETPLAVALIDLNRFKQINDSLGHAVGDDLLRELGGRLQQLADRHGIIAPTRMGGDEFAFLLSQPSLDEVNHKIELISQELQDIAKQPFLLADQSLHIGMSVGWSLYPENAEDRSMLLRQADAAMYLAKRSQLITKVYRSKHMAHISALDVQQALQHALDRQQFHLVYQPQVTCHDKSLVGVEALLRWTHPELGAVTPAEFIPIAESTGLILALGAWVLETACTEVMSWDHPHLSLSVNISPLQLHHPDFGRQVEKILHHTGFPSYRLVLEMQEDALLHEQAPATAQVIKQNLEYIRALGVRISVDDFGTGHSTLLALRQLMTDEVKIDRAFVQSLDSEHSRNQESMAVVRATINLARSLKLDVVAEGVETESQHFYLRQEGCQLMQGWHIAPGLTAEKFKERFFGPRCLQPDLSINEA